MWVDVIFTLVKFELHFISDRFCGVCTLKHVPCKMMYFKVFKLGLLDQEHYILLLGRDVYQPWSRSFDGLCVY